LEAFVSVSEQLSISHLFEKVGLYCFWSETEKQNHKKRGSIAQWLLEVIHWIQTSHLRLQHASSDIVQPSIISIKLSIFSCHTGCKSINFIHGHAEITEL
jgi:hypothetical protein